MQILPWPSLHGGSQSDVSTQQARAAFTTVLTAGTVVLLFVWAAFAHRWISDDGMIMVREARQILGGAGPNYNEFQRDEVDTSTLWMWLLAAFAFVCRGDIAVDAVWLGLTLAVVGLVLALFGCSRLHRQLGVTGVLLPVGALVPVAIAGFWDFATSGLETGLSMCWLGLVWWLSVSVTDATSRSRLTATAVMVGLGPLVRPDFTLVTAVFGVALLLIARPGWWRGLAYAGVGAALPVAYEIFRMGYYGITVPMPALAKEAADSLWARGLAYLTDFANAYLTWVPLLLIALAGARLISRTRIDRRAGALIAAPILSGALLGVYVIKVGGDYMHARMWIPVVFAALLPAMMLPVSRGRRVESVGAALVAVWALIAGLYLRPPYHGEQFGPGGIVGERAYETIAYAGGADLTTTASHTRNLKFLPDLTELIRRGDRVVVMQSRWNRDATLWTVPLSPSLPDKIGWFSDNLGFAAAVMPLDGTVIDVNGLASPVAGHLLVQRHGRPGHEKWLPTAWVLAEYADPAAISAMTDTHDVMKAQVLAARHALSCGRLKELLDSVDEPMSARRFWENLTGAPARTTLRIPADPFDAEREFCQQ